MYKVFYFNPLRVCCYVLATEDGQCVVIDPGAATSRERERLEDFISAHSLTVRAILLTHGHFDHVVSLAPLALGWGVPVYMNPADKGIFDDAARICQALGMEYEPYGGPVLPLKEGLLEIPGGVHINVLETPGHTPGSVCFHLPDEGELFCGDTLFQSGIGRTDLDGGNQEQLMASLRDKILTLPGATKILPGHGKDTTLAEELAYNPFLQ